MSRTYRSPGVNRNKAWYAITGNRKVFLCRADGNTRRLKRLMLAFEMSNACKSNTECVRFRKL